MIPTGDELSISIDSVERIDQYDFVPILKHKPAYTEPLQRTLYEMMGDHVAQKNECAEYKKELDMVYDSKVWKIASFFLSGS